MARNIFILKTILYTHPLLRSLTRWSKRRDLLRLAGRKHFGTIQPERVTSILLYAEAIQEELTSEGGRRILIKIWELANQASRQPIAFSEKRKWYQVMAHCNQLYNQGLSSEQLKAVA